MAVDRNSKPVGTWPRGGFLVLPTDETLHSLARTAAAGTGPPSCVSQAWAATVRLHGPHLEPIPDILTAIHERLHQPAD